MGVTSAWRAGGWLKEEGKQLSLYSEEAETIMASLDICRSRGLGFRMKFTVDSLYLIPGKPECQ